MASREEENATSRISFPPIPREDDSHEYDADPESPLSEEELKSKNVADLVRGNLVVRRQPLIPRVLSVSDLAAVARKPFKPPRSKRYSDHNDELSQLPLVMRKDWGKLCSRITLLYTLLCQGFDGKPMVKRALIVTLRSLVSNWESEIYKHWLHFLVAGDITVRNSYAERIWRNFCHGEFHKSWNFGDAS
ncbi:hypothetical protein J5N97_009762 [Dioscorea zingiberensis]|uniref:Uncharacterized protein n=1 Tax=Dioscorea zingiberensis TaxID=325984 RepID=A0A9D5CZD1_9LILI|nr:hypothetical protein J5N97_009762 [Dioscorea zingiberensis]